MIPLVVITRIITVVTIYGELRDTVKQVFPDSPLKLIPPTKNSTIVLTPWQKKYAKIEYEYLLKLNSINSVQMTKENLVNKLNQYFKVDLPNEYYYELWGIREEP